MKRIVMIILFCFVLCSPLLAGEVYIWTDENGIKHITDTPPPESVKSPVEKETYRPEHPAAIEAFQKKNAAKIDRAHAEQQAQERRKQANIARDRKQSDYNLERIAAEKKQEAARQEYIEYQRKQAESRLEADKRNKNNAHSENSRAFWERQQADEEYRLRRIKEAQK